jgi:hypothetical protein
MTRHGSSCMTVTPMAFWPMARHIPIPELRRAQGTTGCKTNTTSNLTPHKIKSIGPAAALPDRQRLPTRTIPKLIYP